MTSKIIPRGGRYIALFNGEEIDGSPFSRSHEADRALRRAEREEHCDDATDQRKDDRATGDA